MHGWQNAIETHSDIFVNFRADHLKKHIVSHVNNTIPVQMSAALPEGILELISQGSMTMQPQQQ